MHLQESRRSGEREGGREHGDTNKEREGQGEVYDMEGEKMEGGGRKGQRRLGYPAAKVQCHVYPRWRFTERETLVWQRNAGFVIENTLGDRQESSFVVVAHFLTPSPSFTFPLTHTHRHTNTLGQRQLPAPCGAPAERGHVRHQLPSRQLFFSHNSTQLRLSPR